MGQGSEFPPVFRYIEEEGTVIGSSLTIRVARWEDHDADDERPHEKEHQIDPRLSLIKKR
jgi:hypothetical protein